MMKRFLCWFWGHAFVVKAYTGETMEVTNGLGTPLTASLYRFERRSFCVRCGAPAPFDAGGRQE